MPEYAQKSGKRSSGADATRAWTRPASQLSSSSPTSRPGPAAHETLDAALNQTPPVQAVAQLHRALNQSARVEHVAQLSTALQRKPREILQGRFDTVQREGVEDDELLQAKFEMAQRESGREQHLPHEALHVVQQAQGRVLPVLQRHEITMHNGKAGDGVTQGLTQSEVTTAIDEGPECRKRAKEHLRTSIAVREEEQKRFAPGTPDFVGHQARIDHEKAERQRILDRERAGYQAPGVKKPGQAAVVNFPDAGGAPLFDINDFPAPAFAGVKKKK